MTAWLLDTLLYTGLLIAVVLVVRRPVGRWLGPQLAYGLWALPFLRLLMPPIVLPASFAPASEPARQVATVAAEPLWVEAAYTAPAVTFAPVSATAADPLPAVPAWQWIDLAALWAEIGLALWLAGALAFLAWRVVSYRRMCRTLLERARPVGEAGRVRLVETPEVTAPVAFGVLDKVVAMPPCFMAQPDRARRDLAIEHELAHHRGHDLLANFAAQMLLALHWFNPLAWYGWRAMRRDQEAACDARVLAGRGRDDRARYAALIAGIATGPRLALAAPMACPILGEASIIHRLRSLNMSDVSPGRRRLGRVLVAASALALPLTASISYAAAAQVPAPPATPAPPTAPAARAAMPASLALPAPPNAAETRLLAGLELRHPLTPQQPEAPSARLGVASPVPPTAPVPPMPAMPNFDFDGWGQPKDPDFGKKMEAWGRAMEAWGERYGEAYAAQAQAQAQEHIRTAQSQARTARAVAQEARVAQSHAQAQAQIARAQAAQARIQALAQARQAPEVIQSCDPVEQRRTRTEDGRTRVVICQRDIEAQARMGAMMGLRGARGAIAGNPSIDEEVRREILRDLDGEIARLERERD